MRKRYALAAAILACAWVSGAEAKVPFFNASCPGGVDVHADEGGPVFVNGKQARLKTFNRNYYEARVGKLTISISVNPDGSPDISYTGAGGANGVCRVKNDRAGKTQDNGTADGDDQPQPQSSGGVAPGMMPAFCRGEASAKFGVRPNHITTNMAFRSGKGYVVQGNYPDGNGRTSFFNCWFDADGSFASVK